MEVPVFAESGDMNVTDPFGWRIDPVTGFGDNFHNGIDITRWTGYSNLATICAFEDGVIVEAVDGIEGFDAVNQRGNYVTVDHGNGWVSKYYHLENGTLAVSEGETVSAHTPLGYMGSTGYSTGAHLHFQLEHYGTPVDPYPYLAGEKMIVAEALDMNTAQDNVPNEWAREAVEWAQANGIIYGDENGDLMLREPCTREMVVTFLYRARGK